MGASRRRALTGGGRYPRAAPAPEPGASPPAGSAGATETGQQIFRFDTFGDEQFWTDTLHLERVIQQAVDPTTALSVGLKVDMDALPPPVVAGIQQGRIDLHAPATTLALLKLNAVVGVVGHVETRGGRDSLTRVGVTCALCHSNVDDAFARASATAATAGPTTT